MTISPAIILSVLLALVSGTFVALQTPTNALLARGLGAPINGALISFAVGTLALGLCALAYGERPAVGAVRQLPWYAWTGGLYGAFFVTAAIFAAPRIGLTFYVTLLIAGQLAMALIVDKYGLFGLAKEDITLPRVLGVLLVLGGAILVRRG